MIDNVKLIEFGLFEKSKSGNIQEIDSESPSGYFIRTDDLKLLEETDLVYADIGTVFGIKYHLQSKIKSGNVDFQCRISHPKLIHPREKREFSETIEDKYNHINDSNFDFYEFEENWELVPGEWTFEIIENGKVLFSKTFKVIVQ